MRQASVNHDFLSVIWYLSGSTNMLSEQQILLGHLYFRKSTVFPFCTGLLENFNRSSGAVVALAADVHRPYQKKCVPRVQVCTNALYYSEGEKIQQSNRSVAFLFKVQRVFWIKGICLYMHERYAPEPVAEGRCTLLTEGNWKEFHLWAVLACPKVS